MSNIATRDATSPLNKRTSEGAGNDLQASLAELIALSLIGKQLHWNITGPGFRELHLQLDEFVDSWRELSDVVAERAVAIGFSPDGRAPTIVTQSGLEPLEPGPLPVPAAIRTLTDRLSQVAGRVRARLERLGELDLASQDVLIEVTRALEQQLWMLRVQLVDGEGASVERPSPRTFPGRAHA
jgi:starvation-inducible DNA-binding protein